MFLPLEKLQELQSEIEKRWLDLCNLSETQMDKIEDGMQVMRSEYGLDTNLNQSMHKILISNKNHRESQKNLNLPNIV